MGAMSDGDATVRIIGFDHLVLWVDDVERSLAFYLGELGLEPVRVDEWRRGEVFFPSVRVDPTTILDLLQGTVERDGVSLVLVTHDLEAAGRMHRVLSLRDGTLHDLGPSRDLRSALGGFVA